MAPRTAAKRASIIEAASDQFLAHGFADATMDRIAALAGVSKRTVYDHFGDKEQLFAAVVSGVVERATTIAEPLRLRIAAATDLERDLGEVAVAYARGVLQPDVVRLRRLVIREAERFPELARTYFEQAPSTAIAAIAAGLEQLVEAGRLELTDPHEAATHFAYLVLGALVDRALFLPSQAITTRALARQARRGAAAFARAYQPVRRLADPG